ncbi:hypothetical protein LINPERPRIM_LOCUS24535 [Linum perenne]
MFTVKRIVLRIIWPTWVILFILVFILCLYRMFLFLTG